jgi:hypothetical protein
MGNFCVIVQNKSKFNILYFQFTAEIGCGINRNCLYVSTKFAEQNSLKFFFDNDYKTQDITQVINLAA